MSPDRPPPRSACPSAFRPHDLLRLAAIDALIGTGPMPATMPGWVRPALAAAPWVVVRRAPAPDGHIAVGVRGTARDERWAAWLPTRAVCEQCPPEAVADRYDRLPAPRRAALPALAAVPRLAALLIRLGLRGGPTGSVGFELASGRPTATPGSDLDAVVRADTPLDRAVAAVLAAGIGALPVRCDLLLETPNGAVALAEYARGPGPVALRGPRGPRLVADPWAPSPYEETRP
ncbi:malonate decarboxylase holo-ACP synthase [Oleisolibacter albus]|uniref:malonate decarboxylase holo-ACP synthase n=1 Tax=Oleisolibacter albus TaxID=2171757 RepID=UPI000DF4206B|nr:malonate decarboxylase holo-ACP synthase [Oleisolibacter albus]